MTDTPPLRIWPVIMDGVRRQEFAQANAIILACRAGYRVPEPTVSWEGDVLAMVMIGTSMGLLFSQGNPECRMVAGRVLKPDSLRS